MACLERGVALARKESPNHRFCTHTTLTSVPSIRQEWRGRPGWTAPMRLCIRAATDAVATFLHERTPVESSLVLALCEELVVTRKTRQPACSFRHVFADGNKPPLQLPGGGRMVSKVEKQVRSKTCRATREGVEAQGIPETTASHLIISRRRAAEERMLRLCVIGVLPFRRLRVQKSQPRIFLCIGSSPLSVS